MAAKAIDCPDIHIQRGTLLYYTYKVISRIMNPHGIVMIRIILVAIDVCNEGTVRQVCRTILNIFHKTTM